MFDKSNNSIKWQQMVKLVSIWWEVQFSKAPEEYASGNQFPFAPHESILRFCSAHDPIKPPEIGTYRKISSRCNTLRLVIIRLSTLMRRLRWWRDLAMVEAGESGTGDAYAFGPAFLARRKTCERHRILRSTLYQSISK